MHDRRQHPQQDAGMVTREGEVSAHNTASAAIDQGDARLSFRGFENSERVYRRQAEIARKSERPPMRQQEAIARLESHRVGNALNTQPASTRDHGIAFDAVMLSEQNGPFATHIEATRHVAARL